MKSIIVDLGSSTIKIGYNNEDQPKCELPSYIGETYEQIIDGNIVKDENKTYISSACDQFLDNLKLYYPIKNGSFSNKDDIKLIFDYIYKELDITSSQEMNAHPILITDEQNNRVYSLGIKNGKLYIQLVQESEPEEEEEEEESET